MKSLLITLAAVIAAIVIGVCVVTGVYTVSEGLWVAAASAFAGALFTTCGISIWGGGGSGGGGDDGGGDGGE